MHRQPEAATSPPRPLLWSLVLPVKALADAKTRLGGGARRDLALAFAVDTVRAATACRAVVSVVVVTDDDEVTRAVSSLGATVVPDVTGGGLNAALLRGAETATKLTPSVAALPADLPALVPAELEAALAEASAYGASFVSDADASGTTLFAATSARYFRPAYGPDSARRHRDLGAHELLTPSPTLRRDVDTAEDLHAAQSLGVGPATRRLFPGGLPAAASTCATGTCG